jgi:hypothetical protein
MKAILIFLLFFIGIFKSFGQSSHVVNYTPENFDGTYQIEIHNVRFQPNIPGNILEIVQNNRLEHMSKYYNLDENIRIHILSRDEINSADFQRLDFIKYY